LNKAIFLDRDGVIIRERGEYNFKTEHIDYLSGIEKALQVLTDRGYMLIVITNQGGIALNLYNENDVLNLHTEIIKHFSTYHIKISDIFYCPHYPSSSLCICRKPDTLLFEKAIKIFNISVENSYFIGDQLTDEQAGLKIGLKPILISPNANLNDYLHLIE
jgi:D-glycero-D-manno-heptose 1,7-bisphosphate phosphatase